MAWQRSAGSQWTGRRREDISKLLWFIHKNQRRLRQPAAPSPFVSVRYPNRSFSLPKLVWQSRRKPQI